MPPRKQKPPRRERPQQPPQTLVEAENIAVQKTVEKKPQQTQYKDVFIISMPCDPTPGDLAKLYIDIHNHILEIASAVIENNVEFLVPEGGYPQGFDPVIEEGVPVTSPSSQRYTFFIIQIIGRPGEPILQFAIRHDNLYCVGFRALYPPDDVKKKNWYSYGPRALMQSLVFPTVEESNYPESYKTLEGLVIYPEVIRKVYLHFAYFELDGNVTTEGIVLKDTFFVIVCEGSRYKFAQQLALSGIRPGLEIPVRVTALMSDLIRDWSNVSLAILMLWLAEEEEKRRLGDTARNRARHELNKYLKYTGLITFKGPNDELRLDLLAGQSLYAMLYQEVVRNIHIRQLNFVRSVPDKC